jgi:SPP1 gp7 family putative phage head morphogenesis protein
VGKNDKVLGSVRPCCGTEAEYRRRLRLLIDDLHASVTYWIRAAWRANEPELLDSIEEMPEGRLAADRLSAVPRRRPESTGGALSVSEVRHALRGTAEDLPPGLALDAIPAAALQAAIRRLTRRWQRNFNAAAEDLADWFGQSVGKRSDRVLAAHLKKAGITVKFKLSRAQRDVLRATIEQNVSLIRSIPQKYLHDVEGMVMRSVQTGRDLGQLAKALERTYKTTRKRAALIARDQSNKATSALNRSRLIELGISEAIWIHSHAGRVPRPTHLRMHGKKFDVSKGMWDPAEEDFIQPGDLINCRCTSRAVVPGFA